MGAKTTPARVGDGGVHVGEGRGRYALRDSELAGLQDVAAVGELLHVVVVVAGSTQCDAVLAVHTGVVLLHGIHGSLL